MRAWQEDQINALLSIQDENSRFQMITSFAQELGFEYCAYGVRLPLPFSRPKTVMFNNYPLAWQESYQEKGYLAIDPTVQHGMRSLLPVLWSDDLFAGARELWEDARSFGLQHGWAQSSRDFNGVGGLLSLARSGESLSDLELDDKSLKMSWLTQVAHLGLSQQVTAKMVPEARVKLTDREVAVLRWTADGKTSGEISEILNISERTVNFHIQNSMLKLNAANKTAAAVRAAVLGLLY